MIRESGQGTSAAALAFSLTLPPLLFFTLSLLALVVYDIAAPPDFLTIILLVYIVLAMAGLAVDLSMGAPRPEVASEDTLAILFLFSATVMVSLLEYAYFGIPLLRRVIYAEFGFSFLHHVAVTSWLGVPLFFLLDRGLLRWLVLLFAFINPVLMMNRDALLLTIFVFLCSLAVFRGVPLRRVVAFSVIAVLSFAVLGEMRSPGVIATIELPFSFEVDSPHARWLVIYTTSSLFNVYGNVLDLGVDLYDARINVFPEPYLWSVQAGTLVAGLVFYGFMFSVLTLLRIGAQRNLWLFLLLMYFLYQAYMTVFSVKFLTTNSAFVVGFIASGVFLSAFLRACTVSVLYEE
jgi:hypothetical protein